jgi:hypothetical protein
MRKLEGPGRIALPAPHAGRSAPLSFRDADRDIAAWTKAALVRLTG